MRVLLGPALAVGATVIAVAVMGGGPPAPPAEGPIATASDGTGVFSQENSRDAMPVLSAANMKPGDSSTGSVRIRNTGTRAGAFTLLQTPPQDSPGPAGGLLSARLSLKVEDVTAPTLPVTVFSGPLAAFVPRALGALSPDDERTYRFTVTLPEGGTPPGPATGDNAYRASAVSVGYEWVAVEPGSEPPAPPASPPPATGGRGARAPSFTPDRTPPHLWVRVPWRQRLISRRRLQLYTRCTEGCTLSVKARVRAGGISFRLRGRRGVTLPANRRRLVSVRLGARAVAFIRARLSRGRRATVNLRFDVRDEAGNRTVVRKRATCGRSVASQAPARTHSRGWRGEISQTSAPCHSEARVFPATGPAAGRQGA